MGVRPNGADGGGTRAACDFGIIFYAGVENLDNKKPASKDGFFITLSQQNTEISCNFKR